MNPQRVVIVFRDARFMYQLITAGGRRERNNTLNVSISIDLTIIYPKQ